MESPEREIRRSGTKHLHTFPIGELCVGIISHNGSVYVATNLAVYQVVNDELVRLKFKDISDERT